MTFEVYHADKDLNAQAKVRTSCVTISPGPAPDCHILHAKIVKKKAIFIWDSSAVFLSSFINHLCPKLYNAYISYAFYERSSYSILILG